MAHVIKLYRRPTDPRCNEIVLDPINYLCQKWDIPMGEGMQDANIHLFYRFTPGPRPPQLKGLVGVIVDDCPQAYHPQWKRFLFDLKSYHFIVAPNVRVLEYLAPHIGPKASFIFSFVTGRQYYQDLGLLRERDDHADYRMAFTFHGGYTFNVDHFCHGGWKVLYFGTKDLHRNKSVTRVPPLKVKDYYRTMYKFAPDVMVQGWLDVPYFRFKASLKYRDSIVLESCLVADDRVGTYPIEHGVNGFKWNTPNEFHALLSDTPIETFRAIGRSYVDHDYEDLKGLYNQLGTLL